MCDRNRVLSTLWKYIFKSSAYTKQYMQRNHIRNTKSFEFVRKDARAVIAQCVSLRRANCLINIVMNVNEFPNELARRPPPHTYLMADVCASRRGGGGGGTQTTLMNNFRQGSLHRIALDIQLE